MSLDPGIQTFFKEAGEAACYCFCIIRLAEEINPISAKLTNPYRILQDAAEKKFVYYNKKNQEDNDNFYVQDPAGFLAYLTGKKITVRHDSADYKPRKNEFIVERWERKTTKGTVSHFRLKDWDSLADSQTVRFGSVASTRVFTVS